MKKSCSRSKTARTYLLTWGVLGGQTPNNKTPLYVLFGREITGSVLNVSGVVK